MKYLDYLSRFILHGKGGGGEQPILIDNKSITKNGIYKAAYDQAHGYKQVTVRVPNPSTGTFNISQNGSYDVSTYATADVNVPGPSGTGYLEYTADGTYSEYVADYEYLDITVNTGGGGGGGEGYSIAEVLGRTMSGVIDDHDGTADKVSDYALYGAMDIDTLILPAAVGIGNSAFAECSSLLEVYMSHAATIGRDAFNNDYNLKMVDIGNSTDETELTLDYGAFFDCSSLKYLAIRYTVVAMPGDSLQEAFSGTPFTDNTGYLFVPRSMISEYEQADEWADLDANHILALEDYTYDGTLDTSLDVDRLPE